MPARRCLALSILLVLALTSVVHAGKHTESFATTTFKDPINTTSFWDTTGGDLKLPPYVLTLVGTYFTVDVARRVTVDGDHVFVADNSGGLHVIDISDPTNPILAGTYDTPGFAFDVTVDGDLAFVADNVGGLQMIDIADPATPTLIGTYDTPGNAYGVAVDGDLAFVADGVSLQVIDIANPAAPALTGSCNTPGLAFYVVVAGDHAFVADVSGGLQVIDISDPTTPTLVGNYDTPGNAYGVAVAGDHAFVADDASGLQVIDISDPTNPTLAGTYDTPGAAIGVAVAGDRAFVADRSSGLVVLDISDPTMPTLADAYVTPGLAFGVVVAGGHAFVADGPYGLQVIVISDPTPPTLTGSYNTPGVAWGLAVDGDHVFVADGTSGLQVIDISDPALPTLAGTYDTPGTAFGVAVDGDHVFVADGYTGGLAVIDISDPTAPILVGTYVMPDEARSVAVAGGHAFVADAYAGGLVVIDISDPTTPTLTGTYNTPGVAYDVTLAGNYAFVADGPTGLQVIDITDPTAPTLAGSHNTPYSAVAVAVEGDHAFVADGAGGLRVINISNPAAPTLVTVVGTSDFASDVAVAGDRAFVAAIGAGLLVFDISDPATPILVGTYDTPGASRGVVVVGDQAFVGDGSSLQVIQVFQHEVVAGDNVGQSLAFDGRDDVIVYARLSSTDLPDVAWELSADGGANFESFTPGGDWTLLGNPGTDLVWRSTLDWVPPGLPSVSEVTVEWLNEYALITSVRDIPSDQGRQVSVEWTRSSHDFLGDLTQIVEYAIYRKIDLSLASARRSFDELSTVARANALEMQAAGWDYLASVPVLVEDTYAVVVPTLADSTIAAGDYFSTFRVTALTATPGVFFHSPPDSGYSLDNLAPSVPAGMAVAYGTGSGNTLSWNEAPEADFKYFSVYRSNDPGFTPDPGNLVHSTTTPGWVDPDNDQAGVHYKVTATDHSGNESDAATAGTVTSVPNPGIPAAFALHQNAPNPFSPGTMIRYDVARGGGAVTLEIFDVSGRLVRTLVDQDESEGQKRAIWNGQNSAGRKQPPGTYFYRLVAPGFSQTRKMVLLR